MFSSKTRHWWTGCAGCWEGFPLWLGCGLLHKAVFQNSFVGALNAWVSRAYAFRPVVYALVELLHTFSISPLSPFFASWAGGGSNPPWTIISKQSCRICVTLTLTTRDLKQSQFLLTELWLSGMRHQQCPGPRPIAVPDNGAVCSRHPFYARWRTQRPLGLCLHGLQL